MTLKVIFATLIMACSLSLSAQLQFSPEKSIELRSSKGQTPKLSIYPNPTSDFFAVKSDAGISKIVVYNWIGKQLESYAHYKDRLYNVEDFDKGIYIVRLFDKENKLIKVLRLHRN